VRFSRSKTQSRIVPIDTTAERALRRWLRTQRVRLQRDDAPLLGSRNGPQLVAHVVKFRSDGEMHATALMR
jgi:site-specific recombinase XerC